MNKWGRVGEPEIRHVYPSGAMTWWDRDGYLSEIGREFGQAGFKLFTHSFSKYTLRNGSIADTRTSGRSPWMNKSLSLALGTEQERAGLKLRMINKTKREVHGLSTGKDVEGQPS